MAIFLHGCKAILNVCYLTFSHFSWPIMFFLAAVSSTSSVSFFSLFSHKPVRFALPGVARGTNHLDKWHKLARHTL